MAAPVILVEAQPRRAADGQQVTVRLAGGGGDRPYFYGDVHWRAGIAGLPTSIAKLAFDGKQLGGGGVPEALEIRWTPATNAALAGLADYYWTDAAISVRIGAEGPAMPPIDTIGVALSAKAEGGALTIALAEATADLKRPLLVDRFAGTGGIEGPVEWEGLVRSRAWGRCYNVPGKPIWQNIWCFGDPRRSWQAFDQVRDLGVAATSVTILAWQGSVEATFVALQAAVAPAGGGVFCPSICCVKWWTQPAGDLHADIRGENAGGYVETAAAIVERLVAARSTLTIGAGEVAAAVAARPGAFGYRCDDDSTTAATAVSEVLGDVSLSWVLVDGSIAFRRWDWTAPTRAARSIAVVRRETVKPVANRRIGYRRNQAPMARGDLAAAVFATDVVFEDGSNLNDLADRVARASDGVLNLLDMSGWNVGGTGSAGRFGQNGEDGENGIVLNAGPSGGSEPLWKMVSGNGPGSSIGAADGGWDYTLSDAADGISPTKSYRLMVWVRRDAGASGSIWLGTGSDLGMIEPSGGNPGGSANNPYFFVGTTPTAGKWFLLVGVLHGSSYGGTDSGVSGLYDPATGERVAAGGDWVQKAGATRIVHRAYQFYTTGTSTSYFAKPSVEEIGAATYTVQQLLATVGMTASQRVELTAAQARLTAIGSDNIIAAGAEKRDLLRLKDEQDNAAFVAFNDSLNLASIYGGDPTASYRQARDAVINARDAYLNTLIGWNDFLVDTPVDGAALAARFTAVGAAIINLVSANAAFVRDRTKAAQDRVAAISSDNVLSAGSEKNDAIIDWNDLTSRNNALNDKYVALGSPADLATVRGEANNRVDQLGTYLGSLPGPWNNVGNDSNIDGATWREKWGLAYAAVNAYNAAITGRKGDKGDSALNAVLSNQHFNVPTLADGSYASFPVATSEGQVLVYLGGTDVTSQCTFSINNPYALDGRVNSATGAYYAVGLYADTGYSFLTATYAGVSVVLKLTASKTRGGANGSTPPDIKIAATALIGKQGADGNYLGGQSVTWTAQRNSAAPGPTLWTFFRGNGGIFGNAWAQGYVDTWPAYFVRNSDDSLTLNGAGIAYFLDTFGDAPGKVTMRVAAGGVYDEVELRRVKDGANGQPGAPGLTAALTPASASIACNYTGNPKSGQLPRAAQVTILSGSSNVTSASSYAIVATENATATVSAAGVVSLNSVTADAGSVMVRSTYGGASIDQKLSYSKSKDGAQGASAYDDAIYAPFNSTLIQISSKVLEIPVGPGGTMRVSFNVSFRDDDSQFTMQVLGKYREKGSTTWLDFPGANGQATSFPFEPNSIYMDASSAGPASAAIYQFSLWGRRVSGSSELDEFNYQPFTVSWGP